MLSVVEAVGVLLMCLLLVPHPVEPPRLAFDFRLNLEDVAAASALRRHQRNVRLWHAAAVPQVASGGCVAAQFASSMTA